MNLILDASLEEGGERDENGTRQGETRVLVVGVGGALGGIVFKGFVRCPGYG